MTQKPSLREMAIMAIDEGEEIAGAWITPYIKGTGMYKLQIQTCTPSMEKILRR